MTIAEYIKEDLGIRVRAGHELPSPLTLASLASLYQVSFTPVRAAVSKLIDEGVLKRGPDRRLIRLKTQLSRRGPKLPDAPAPPKDIGEIIANDLVQLSFQGEAIYLREEAMAEKYGISRSAIRNIFHRLAGSEILNHLPRRGWQLRAFRSEDLQGFLEVREVLELKALELSRNRLVPADLQNFLSRNDLPLDRSARPKIDNSFHAYIIEKSRNRYIQDFFRRHGPYYNILFAWEDQDRQCAIEAVRQHRKILKALLDKDWRATRRALSHHIRHNHPILSKIKMP